MLLYNYTLRGDELNKEKQSNTGLLDKELELAVAKHWNIQHEGNEIIIINKMNQELLFVNGECLAENSRSHPLASLKPYQRLNGIFQDSNGQLHQIEVKLGGFFMLNIRVMINNQLIFKDKIKIFK